MQSFLAHYAVTANATGGEITSNKRNPTKIGVSQIYFPMHANFNKLIFLYRLNENGNELPEACCHFTAVAQTVIITVS